MLSTVSVIAIALVTLLAGIGIGAALWRQWASNRNNSVELEQRLAEAERRLGSYQAEVAEHFVETARRVNDLTRSYKDVHDYLASSATKLTDPVLGREIRAAAQLSWSGSRLEPAADGASEQDSDNGGSAPGDGQPGESTAPEKSPRSGPEV